MYKENVSAKSKIVQMGYKNKRNKHECCAFLYRLSNV